MRAVLPCDIPVHRVAVFAEMAWMERRPELGLLCTAARANGGMLTAQVVQSVLPGLGAAGATNVIAWCALLGLCDEGGGITALGDDVAAHDEAPVPEQGVYDLWLAEHPLLGRRLLAAERIASKRDARFEQVGPLPIRPERNKLFFSLVDKRQRFLLRQLPANHDEVGCVVRETAATCRLRWTLDFSAQRDSWQLDGRIEAPMGKGQYELRPIGHDPESERLDLWPLADRWGAGPLGEFGLWRTEQRELGVALTGLSATEQDTFKKSFTLDRVEVPGKGTYTNATVENVAIGPLSAAEAQRWAMARLDRKLESEPRYRSRSEVRRLFWELTKGTPLERFGPVLPAHGPFLEERARSSELFWSLAAPVDLAPVPVPSEELAELPLRETLP